MGPSQYQKQNTSFLSPLILTFPDIFQSQSNLSLPYYY